MYQSNLAQVPIQFSDARQRLQNVKIMRDIPAKKYPLILSEDQQHAVATQKIKDFIEAMKSGDLSSDATMRSILLQETLLLNKDQDFIQLQVDSWDANFVQSGVAFEHGVAFGLALIVAFLIQVITQVYKDPQRFNQKDFDERIELEKTKMKIQIKQKIAQKEAQRKQRMTR